MTPPGRRDPKSARLIRSATYASVLVASSLMLVKVWAWLATDSVALLGSLADSLLDTLSSCLTFWAVRYSLAPADSEHRFGHGKAEGLAALLQSVVIAGSGIYVSIEAVGRLLNPAPISQPSLGIAVIGGATLATIALVSYQHFVARRTGSVAIVADAMHYKVDVLVNLGVAGAITVTATTGWQLVDPLVGLAVSAYIIRGAWGIGNQALGILLDKEIPLADRQRIREMARRHPEVLGFHDMRTRHGGSHYIIQFHLEMDPAISLLRSHEILDEVEAAIRKAYPGCEIIIHADPLGLAERRDGFEESLHVARNA